MRYNCPVQPLAVHTAYNCAIWGFQFNFKGSAPMNIPPAKRRQPSVPSPIILPDELISEVLSWLTVKSLMRLRCVCKSWNTLISDHTFIQLHLHRSARNPRLALVLRYVADIRVKPFSVSSILENPSSITLDNDPYYGLKIKDCRWVVGSCNGLFCTLGCSGTPASAYRDVWFRFWNPATRKLSEQLGFFRDYGYHFRIPFKKNLPTSFRFTLGYDNSTNIYKVVALRLDVDSESRLKTTVRVFNLGDNVWRDIQSFPVVTIRIKHRVDNYGVYLSNSLSWLALRNDDDILSVYYEKKDITVEQFVIISLDLETEMNKQLRLPRGFDVVPDVEPILCVLMDNLCFSHDFKRTHFVIWQLKQFGVEESWTQFIKITYQNPILEPTLPWLPLHLSQNSDILILANNAIQVILYNCRDNRVERTRTTDKTCWYFAKDYVESLVLTS